MSRTAAPNLIVEQRGLLMRDAIWCARRGTNDAIGNRSSFAPYTGCDTDNPITKRIESTGIGHKFEIGIIYGGKPAALDQTDLKSNAAGPSVAFQSGV
ncbi:MAG: hypothetical protein ACU0FH_15160 [Heliomarina sp.]|uniref:hypothetical protein n=1 Tax=Heliomarina sp. TaxID=2917556 RepID=UPI004059E390